MLSKYPLILKNRLLRAALDMKISNAEKAMKRAWLVLSLCTLLDLLQRKQNRIVATE